jgi:hypothetical protein
MLLRIALMLVALCFGGGGQTLADGLNTHSAIYNQVEALDFKIFEAYNTCDLKTLADMVDDNLEFYHDKTGLSLGKANFINAIKNNICHQVRRELLASSLEVFPLQDYGAIEIGQHVFHAVTEAGREIPFDARCQLRSFVGSGAQGIEQSLNAARFSSASRAAAQDWSYGRRGRSDRIGCRRWRCRAGPRSTARK